MNKPINYSCMFGNGNYCHENRVWSDFKISLLGKFCGIGERKLEWLLYSRGFLSCSSDLLLLDPLSRFANKIARGETERRVKGEVWIYNQFESARAGRDINLRKFSTLVIWILPLILLFDYYQYGVDPNTLEVFVKWEACMLAIITLAQYLTHILR